MTIDGIIYGFAAVGAMYFLATLPPLIRAGIRRLRPEGGVIDPPPESAVVERTVWRQTFATPDKFEVEYDFDTEQERDAFKEGFREGWEQMVMFGMRQRCVITERHLPVFEHEEAQD